MFVGMLPNINMLPEELEKDQWGYIITDGNMATNIETVYAAGDVRSKVYRQIATAVNDGAIAAINFGTYLKNCSDCYGK